MAKIYGLNGAIRGKQGNNVFSVVNGVQVLKQYQPAVSNPKTALQRQQRTKFSLAGRISSATPAAALVGMVGANIRLRRARFVSLITKRATLTTSNGEPVATIAYDLLQWSDGALAVYSALSGNPSVSWTGTAGRENVNVSVPAMGLASFAPAGYGELVIVALFDGQTSQLDEVRVAARNTSSATSILFRIGARRDLRVAVYIVPFASASARAAFDTSLLYDSEAGVNVAGNSSTSAPSTEYGESVLWGVYPLLGTAQTTHLAPEDDTRSVVEEALLETAVAEGKKKK